jgi:hypothetical protein
MSESSGLIDSNDPKPRGAVEGAGGAGSGPAVAARSFLGFDRERSTYLRLKPELLKRAPGQFVVIVGDDFEGPVPTFDDAERAGYRRFGFGPLYIKQVLAEGPVLEVSRDIRACRP